MSESPAADESAGQPGETTPAPHRWQVFGITVAVASLTILDLSKVNVALPTIETQLGASTVDLQLIVAGYALAFGLTLVPAGRLGDIGSRRTLFIAGIIGFGLASLLCGLAPTAGFLLAARIVQGVSAGVILPQVLGMIQQLFQGRDRGRAFGLFGAVIGLSTAFGPTIGGLLIGVASDDLGWRLTFWMNVPIALVLAILAIRLVPRVQQRYGRLTIDPVGILLLGIGIFSLMLPFVFTSGSEDDDPARWWWLLVCAVATLAFVFWERAYRARGNDPVLDFALLTHRSYRYGLLLASAYFAAIPSIFLIVTLYLQQGLGLAAVFAGMVSIPFALASAVTAWLSGKVVHRYGRSLVVLGLIVAMGGFVLVLVAGVFLPAELSPWGMAAAMTVAGAGGGAVISPNQTLLLAQVPVAQGGVAGSFAQAGQRAGTAIGVAAVSSTFFATIYRETGTIAELEVFHDALRNGLLVAIGLLALALVFALLDRPRKAGITSGEPALSPRP